MSPSRNDEAELRWFQRWVTHKVGHHFGRHHQVEVVDLPDPVNVSRSIRVGTRLQLPGPKHTFGSIFPDDCEEPYIMEGKILVDGRLLTVSWIEAGEHSWVDMADPLAKGDVLVDSLFPHTDVQFISEHRVIKSSAELEALPPADTPRRGGGWSAGF